MRERAVDAGAAEGEGEHAGADGGRGCRRRRARPAATARSSRGPAPTSSAPRRTASAWVSGRRWPTARSQAGSTVTGYMTPERKNDSEPITIATGLRRRTSMVVAAASRPRPEKAATMSGTPTSQRRPVGAREVEAEQQLGAQEVGRRAERGDGELVDRRRAEDHPGGRGRGHLGLQRPHHLRHPDPLGQHRDADLLELGPQKADHHEAEVVAVVGGEVRVDRRADEAREKKQRADRQPEAEDADDERRCGSRPAPPARAGRRPPARAANQGSEAAEALTAPAPLRSDRAAPRRAAARRRGTAPGRPSRAPRSDRCCRRWRCARRRG